MIVWWLMIIIALLLGGLFGIVAGGIIYIAHMTWYRYLKGERVTLYRYLKGERDEE